MKWSKRWPSSEPEARSARIMSPVEIWGTFEQVHQALGLRALARTGRSEQNEIHAYPFRARMRGPRGPVRPS